MRPLSQCRKTQIKVGDEWQDVTWEQLDSGDVIRMLPVDENDTNITDRHEFQIIELPHLMGTQNIRRYASARQPISAEDVLVEVFARVDSEFADSRWYSALVEAWLEMDPKLIAQITDCVQHSINTVALQAVAAHEEKKNVD